MGEGIITRKGGASVKIVSGSAMTLYSRSFVVPAFITTQANVNFCNIAYAGQYRVHGTFETTSSRYTPYVRLVQNGVELFSIDNMNSVGSPHSFDVPVNFAEGLVTLRYISSSQGAGGTFNVNFSIAIPPFTSPFIVTA